MVKHATIIIILLYHSIHYYDNCLFTADSVALKDTFFVACATVGSSSVHTVMLASSILKGTLINMYIKHRGVEHTGITFNKVYM